MHHYFMRFTVRAIVDHFVNARLRRRRSGQEHDGVLARETASSTVTSS